MSPLLTVSVNSQTDPVSLNHGEGMGGVRTGQRRIVSRPVRGRDRARHRRRSIILDDGEYHGVRHNWIGRVACDRVYSQAADRAGGRCREEC